jgi:uncharacterized protein
MNKSKTAIAVLALSLSLFAPVSAARAQFFPQGNAQQSAENIEGFTVTGKGSVSAKPNLVEIDLEVAATSELTADAIVKYRDARRKLREAFSGLKLENVGVEERGLLVDQKGTGMNPYFFGGQQNTRTKTEVQLTRKLVVTASNIRKMEEDALLQLIAKLLDVAQDAGGKIGGQSDFNPYFYYRFNQGSTAGLVRFVLDDFDSLQEEAYEKAIADARARAARLAKLSRVELGPIVAIREVVVPGEKSTSADDEGPLRKRLETSKFQDIPVRVELLVRFEVHSNPENKGRTGER